MAETLLAGVDGGGTHCRVRICRADGSPVGAAAGGTANVFSGVDAALASILDTMRAALAAGGLGEAHLACCHVGLGLAGANVPSVAAALHARPLPFAAHALETDALTACRGAFAGRDGAIGILGTGTAYALRVGGAGELLGGWGPLVSDQGSGADLGRRALAAALLAFDGAGPATPLTHTLLTRFGNSPAAITEFARDAMPRDFGQFAPIVWDRAEAGDAVGEALIAEALAVIESFARRCLERGAPRIAFLGGQAERYRARLSPDIALRTVDPSGDALDGAIDLARGTLPARACGTGAA